MAYVVEGLSPEPFAHLFQLGDAELAGMRARRVRAAGNGYPCRVSLEDAGEGEELIVLHHVSHDVETPYRSAFAIYVREGAKQAPPRRDSLPPMLEKRRLSLRGYDESGVLLAALVSEPGDGDRGVRGLLSDSSAAEVHAHNAATGCFLARIRRERA